MCFRMISLVALFVTACAGGALAQGDPDNGKILARTNCARCHGIDGNARSTSFQPVPMLAGQPAVYLAKEMRKFVSGTREDTSKGGAMTRTLGALSESDYDDLAAFFAAQKRY